MSSPLSLLDLPREIRDIIYDYALISPTGYVTPFLCKKVPHIPARKKPGRTDSPKANFQPYVRLHLVPCESAYYPGSSVHTSSNPDLECGCSLPDTISGHELPLAYSLPQACKQIQAETDGVFWKHNAICFSNTQTFPVIMKHMGQTQSRKIRGVQLTIDPIHLNAEGFARAIKKLASRTRLGSLERIEVAAIGFSHWFRNGSIQDAIEDSMRNSVLCHALAKAQDADWARDKGEIKVERTLLVCCYGLQDGTTVVPRTLPWETTDRTLERLHTSWGGKLIFNEELVWENGLPIIPGGD